MEGTSDNGVLNYMLMAGSVLAMMIPRISSGGSAINNEKYYGSRSNSSNTNRNIVKRQHE